MWVKVMSHVLGGFSSASASDTLLQRHSEQSNDLAALKGARFVIASEVDEGRALAEGRIKSLTGGDTITCRKLFEEYESYTPTFKLNLATNAKPRVTGTDKGIWRRILLIPCEANITNPDRQLVNKLQAESAGIFNWLVEGYQGWQEHGLTIPQCVKDATAEYRFESDIIARFLEDKRSPWPYPESLQVSNVYKHYKLWSEEQGHRTYAQNKFSQKMAEHGLASEKRGGQRVFPDSLKAAKIPKSKPEIMDELENEAANFDVNSNYSFSLFMVCTYWRINLIFMRQQTNE